MLTPDQIEARKEGIGGSDVGKILGKSQWGSPYDVYLEKIGESENTESTINMLMGDALEEMIIREYEKNTGFKVTRYKDPSDKPFIHQEHSFMRANLDGFVESNRIVVEAKTAGNRVGWGAEGTNNIPIDYLLQVMHYCSVMNVDRADIIVLFIDERKYGYYRYDRHLINEAKMIEAERRFWFNNVKDRVSPAPTTLEHLKIEFKKENGNKLYDDDVAELCFEISDKTTQISNIKKAIDELKFKAQLIIGSYSEVIHSSGRRAVTWTNQPRVALNQKRFKKEIPDIHQQYMDTSDSRVFRPKKRKAK